MVVMRVFVFATFLLCCSIIIAQLTTVVQNPTTLVQNLFLGDNNVNIFNISYQGATGAIGRFNAPNTNLGINTGIIMTTGTILTNNTGPLGPNNLSNAGMDNGQPGYQLLTNIVGTKTFNAAVLSFDFQTCSDSIEFRYVFGSEEYPEFVGTQYNDVFGFFISGPGIPGQQNIARLPNGSTVSINNINNGNPGTYPGIAATGPSNPQYFVPNGDGTQSPYNSPSLNYIQYDGFTKVLTAKVKVECGETYHLIMAIADVSDSIYDSGIFLEANSFKSSSAIKTSYSLSSQAFDEPNALVRACSNAKIKLKRSKCNLQSPITVNVTTAGDAIPGIDFQALPTSVTIPANIDSTEFTFHPIYNGTPLEADKIVQVILSYTDNCGTIQKDTMDFILRDMVPLELTLSDQWSTCPGDTITLTPNITGGGGQYHYKWSTGETSKSIIVQPTITSSYYVTIIDECSHDSIGGELSVHVPIITPIVLSGSADEESICPYVPTTFFVQASGGFGDYTYQWVNNHGETFGLDSVQSVLPKKTTIYTVTVKDKCGQMEKYSVTYTVLSPPLIVDVPSGIEICPGDSVELITTVTGGYGKYYYHWPHSNETSPDVWVHPWVSTKYEVVVSDDCQTFTVSGFPEVIVVKPKADFNIVSNLLFNNIPITFHNQSSNASSYIWDFGDGQSTTIVHPSHVFEDPKMYVVMLTAIDDKGCIDSIKKNVTIVEEYYIYIPNTFTPDGDRTNAFFSVKTVNVVELHIDIFNRWGEIVYSSNNLHFAWDGTYNGTQIPDGLYVYKVVYTASNGTQEELIGHVNVLH